MSRAPLPAPFRNRPESPVPESWVAPLPIAQIDRYLVGLRWVIILLVGVPSLFGGFEHSGMFHPGTVLLVIIIYNLPVSIFIWLKQPLAHHRITWLILGDVLQAVLAVVVTSGYTSFFFIFFMLVMVEIALGVRWRPALGIILGILLLQAAVTIFTPSEKLEAFAAYIIVSKFLLSLIVGGVAVLFAELVRREERMHRQAEHIAARIAALNALFIRLEATKLNLQHTLAIILDSVHTISNVACAFVLLPNEHNDTWEIMASTSSRHPTGQKIEALPFATADDAIFEAGIDCATPLPTFLAHDDIPRITGVVLHSADERFVGALMIGRQSTQPLSDDEQAFLRSLALEAGLALRNARLFVREQEHVARLEDFRATQSTFFSAIGHELKTPLAVLKMLAPSLHELPDLPPNTRSEIIDTINHNLQRLESLISDMLESARLEARAVALHPRPVEMVSLAQRIIENLSPLMARKNQQAVLDAAAGLPAVWVDPRRGEQVLSNLVRNAIKFAPADSAIIISVQPQGDVVQTCITDNGPGVPPEQRNRIFDKFYTTNNNQALAGAGLGLFISRQLIEQSGGRIWVEDHESGGSRFCFTLPVAKTENGISG